MLALKTDFFTLKGRLWHRLEGGGPIQSYPGAARGRESSPAWPILPFLFVSYVSPCAQHGTVSLTS
jgi:hypothetical protein